MSTTQFTHRHDDDGQRILENKRKYRVIGTAVLHRPVLNAKIQAVHAVTKRDVVVIQLLENKYGHGQDKRNDPDQQQDEGGAEYLQTLFRRIDDDLHRQR